jgi:hypothetical protein
MLLLFAVLAGIAAAFWLVRYANRPALGHPHSDRISIPEPQNLRPLFEPTEEEMRAFERGRLEKEAAERRAAEDAAREEQETKLRRLLSAWRSEPGTQNAIDLLEHAAAVGEAEAFAEAAEEILKSSNEQGVGGLSPSELAALVGSHMRLLPQAERSSGALFWLKEEMARLRREN